MDDLNTLYNYNDYRDFLKDYFQKKKEMKKTFSLRYFAQKAGFSDHSQLIQLVNGRRNVTEKSLVKLLHGLEFSGSSKEYFIALVHFTQAKTVNEKHIWYKKISTIRNKSELYNVGRSQYEFFSEWYYSVVRDVATASHWNGDFKKLGELIIPSISAEMAEMAVELLVKIGMLECEDGVYKKCDNVVSTGSVPLFMIHKARNELANIGADASERFTEDEVCNVNSGILIPEHSLEKYYALLDRFEKKFEALVVDENGEQERMYQMNLQFFPTTVSLKRINDESYKHSKEYKK